jgi:hypothetical protein
MSSIRSQFSDGSVGILKFKADLGNNGVFFLGSEPSGCFYPIDAGEVDGWSSINNMNDLYYYDPSGTSDYLYYWLQY